MSKKVKIKLKRTKAWQGIVKYIPDYQNPDAVALGGMLRIDERLLGDIEQIEIVITVNRDNLNRVTKIDEKLREIRQELEND